MLKFFRKYNKYILVVGVALLMVAFLIQPTLSMFGPNPAGEVLGTIDGEEVTRGEQRQAGNDLAVLREVAPVLFLLTGNGPAEIPSPLQWLLMLRDAQGMGLSASDTQVRQLLGMLELDDPALAKLAHRLNISIDAVRQAIQHWLVIQSYKELVNGLEHLSVEQRLKHYAAAAQFSQFGYYQGAAVEIESAFKGTPRLSEPLLKRFLYDHQAMVRITAVSVPKDPYRSRIDEPTENDLTDLFERYKEVLPGKGKPYRLGYRIPNRVKIEYLAVPIDTLQEQFRVEEADALSYYDNHKDQFREIRPGEKTNPDEGAIKPYGQVRAQIIDGLRQERTAELGDQMIKAAQAILLDNARTLAEKNGYRAIQDGWKPISLEDLAQQLQQQFDVLPQTQRYDDQWLTNEQLNGLPGIGSSHLAGQPDVSFAQYIMSTKELLGEDDDHPLIALRLQEKLPSASLTSPSGGRYLFRVIEAQPSRVPTSLDEVRDTVIADAKRVAAYEYLRADIDTWQSRAQQEGLEELAKLPGLSRIAPAPFPKRQAGFGGQLQVPLVHGVGRSGQFIDGVFELVDQVVASLTGESTVITNKQLDQLPPPQRTAAVAVDNEMKIFLVRLEGLQPMTRGAYENVANSTQVGAWVNQTLLDEQKSDPLSVDAVSDRIGFNPSINSDEEDDGP